MIVLRLPSPFSSSSLTALRSPSSFTAARSPSSKTGSETTYFSLAQLPRSRRRQRSLQKGKSVCTAESVGALQIGQRCCIPYSFVLLLPRQYSSTENAERGAGGDTRQRFRGRHARVCKHLARCGT